MGKIKVLGAGDYEAIAEKLSSSDLSSVARAQEEATIRFNLSGRLANELFALPLLDGASPEMNVNGSVTPVAFKFTAPVDVFVTSINGVMVDGGINPETFGGLPALTNGIDFEVYDSDDVLSKTFTLIGIKQNWEFSLISTTATTIFAGGGVEDIFEFGINFGVAGGSLYLPKDWYFLARVNDDLSPMSNFRVQLNSYSVATDAYDYVKLI